MLVRFFNEYGGDDVYPRGGGFPSRWNYAETKIREHNGTAKMAEIIADALHPAHFLGTEFSAAAAAEALNDYLRLDGYEIVQTGDRFRVGKLGAGAISPTERLTSDDPLTSEFLSEHLEKCQRKLLEGDFPGAITNARSLVELVLVELATRVEGERPDHRGDLPKLYKKVRKLLNIEPSSHDAVFQPILTGLIAVVNGLAEVRNAMSDSHAARYKAAERHARLAVTVAYAVTEFLHASFEHQLNKGGIKLAGSRQTSS